MKRCRLWAILCWAALILLTNPAYAETTEDLRPGYKMKIALIEEESRQEKPRIQVSAQVKVVNDSEDAWNEVCFRDFMSSVYAWHHWEIDERRWFSGVRHASCGGKELEFEIRPTETLIDGVKDSSAVYVKLHQPLLPGESTIISLEYEAEVPMGGMRCSYSRFDPNDGGARTYELAQFYPMLAIYENGAWQADPYFTEGECFYTKCADYEVLLYVPEHYEVIASGSEKRIAASGGISEWRICAENMRDVSIVISNEMEKLSGEVCGVTINSWHAENEKAPVSDDHEEQGSVMLDAAIESIEAFTEAYGPYPYGELDVVESGYYFGGMEAPGLVRVSQMYSWSMGEDDSEEERAEAIEDCRATTAHEVAHEWFYAVVGNDQYKEAWLDESLAAYSEQVYWRQMGRSEEEIAGSMKLFTEHMPPDGNMTVDRRYDLLNTKNHVDYIGAVYQRGAGFLHQLEQCVGQERFYAFLKEYYTVHAFKEAHTEDFLSMLSPYISGNNEAQTLAAKYLESAR